MSSDSDFIQKLIALAVPQVAPLQSAAQWKQTYLETAPGFMPIDRAILSACRVDRLAYAFASGYQGALQSLIPTIGAQRIGSFCVSEEQGNRPRHIRTQLELSAEGGLLSGSKSFITCAAQADCLAVAASTGIDEQGRNSIRLVLVDSAAAGVSVEEMPPLGFVPELSHGITRFEQVAIAPQQVLPGDGYSAYVKPFRTVEDIHVGAAVLAYLYGAARRFGWPRQWAEELLLALASARELAAWPPGEAHTHLLLAAHQRRVDSLMSSLEPVWESCDVEERQRWQRDRKLMAIAGKARQQRQLKAHETLGF